MEALEYIYEGFKFSIRIGLAFPFAILEAHKHLKRTGQSLGPREFKAYRKSLKDFERNMQKIKLRRLQRVA